MARIITNEQIVDIMRELMVVCVKVAGPVLVVSIIVGLIISIFQAATQIHEQTLTFVPKLLVIALLLLMMGSWIYGVISGFTVEIFDLMASV